MAAPYCTLTGTIPGGENGRALVRIVPDVKGATATVEGAAVSMREHMVRTDQTGAVNIEVLAPGAGVTPLAPGPTPSTSIPPSSTSSSTLL